LAKAVSSAAQRAPSRGLYQRRDLLTIRATPSGGTGQQRRARRTADQAAGITAAFRPGMLYIGPTSFAIGIKPRLQRTRLVVTPGVHRGLKPRADVRAPHRPARIVAPDAPTTRDAYSALGGIRRARRSPDGSLPRDLQSP
jgi:hypothetical protein